MVKSSENNEADILAKFPEPVILPSRVKWWWGIWAGCVFIILGIVARHLPYSSVELTLAFYALVLIGVVSIVCGVALFIRPGACLRLDEAGFEVVGPFRKQIFRWSDVSDFGVWSRDKSSFVAFKAAKPRLTNSDRLNAALTGGRNGLLPDTYGMAADDLVRLMTTWQNSAINATTQTVI